MVTFDTQDLVTPNGRPVRFLFRRDTSDHNTIHSACTFDEYALKGLTLEGWALDLGSHVGGVGVPLAIDHPDLQVICVEPVPDNAELVREHAAMNGVADRVHVLDAAVGEPGTTTKIRFGFRDADGNHDHHAWIGNTSLIYATAPVEPHDEIEIPCVSLLDLAFSVEAPAGQARVASHIPVLVKVDAEGGEWGCLDELVKLESPRVVGEWHPVCGRDRVDELHDAFQNAGYSVDVTGPIGGPGGFLATR